MADGGRGVVDGRAAAGLDLGHRSGGQERAEQRGATHNAGGGPMIPSIDYMRILPELILAIAGILVMIIEPALGEHDDRRSVAGLAFIGTLAATAATVYQALNHNIHGLGWFGMVRVDSF